MSDQDKLEGMEKGTPEQPKAHNVIDAERLERAAQSAQQINSARGSFVGAALPNWLEEATPEQVNDKIAELREAIASGPLPIFNVRRRYVSMREVGAVDAPLTDRSAHRNTPHGSTVRDTFGLVAALNSAFPDTRVIQSADGTYARVQLDGKSVSLNANEGVVVAAVYQETMTEAQTAEDAETALRILLRL